MLEDKSYVRRFLREGAEFVPTWRLRTEIGIDGLVKLLDKAYQDTSDVYVHFDMDVLGRQHQARPVRVPLFHACFNLKDELAFVP